MRDFAICFANCFRGEFTSVSRLRQFHRERKSATRFRSTSLNFRNRPRTLRASRVYVPSQCAVSPRILSPTSRSGLRSRPVNLATPRILSGDPPPTGSQPSRGRLRSRRMSFPRSGEGRWRRHFSAGRYFQFARTLRPRRRRLSRDDWFHKIPSAW